MKRLILSVALLTSTILGKGLTLDTVYKKELNKEFTEIVALTATGNNNMKIHHMYGVCLMDKDNFKDAKVGFRPLENTPEEQKQVCSNWVKITVELAKQYKLPTTLGAVLEYRLNGVLGVNEFNKAIKNVSSIPKTVKTRYMKSMLTPSDYNIYTTLSNKGADEAFKHIIDIVHVNDAIFNIKMLNFYNKGVKHITLKRFKTLRNKHFENVRKEKHSYLILKFIETMEGNTTVQRCSWTM